MESEESDILGGRLSVLPVGPTFWSGLSPTGQISLVAGVATVALLSWLWVEPVVRQWREMRYRKAMRRKHGIPDGDHRPFNVAYAAATRLRQQLEEQEKARRKQGDDSTEASVPALPPHTAQSNGMPFGRLQHIAGSSPATGLNGSVIPAGVASGDRERRGHVTSRADFDISHQDVVPGLSGHSTRHQGYMAFPPVEKPHPVSEPSHRVDLTSEIGRSRGKRALDEETQARPETRSKKSRTEEEAVEEREDMSAAQEPEEEMDIDQGVQPSRGSKRAATAEDDEGIEAGRSAARDKRARKVSREKAPEVLDLSMGDQDKSMDADEVPELESSARGKKRDRAEAGSTFGGDDSFVDDEDEKSRRFRKRRTVSHRKSEARLRGQKRGRDAESVDSDGEDAEQRKSERRKRGKRDSAVGAVSLDEGGRSQDPLCKGKRIGEEWKVNDVWYRVGPNGHRLRQVHIKRSHSKFPMPKDSQHPDRQTNVDVYVETWLSEEDYKLAQERHELLWQDSPAPSEPATPGDVPDTPGMPGKSLLWSSTTPQVPDSPVPQRGPFRQSIATNVGLRLNPFSQSQIGQIRRVSSIYHTALPPAPDSPKLRSSKSYSKWEKQDLEAAAMMKLREKTQREAQLAEQAKKAAIAPPVPTLALPAPNASAFDPSSTLTKPADKPEAGQITTPFSFGTPQTAPSSTIPSTLSIPTFAPPATTANAASPNPWGTPSSIAPTKPAVESKPASNAAVPNFFGAQQKSQQGASAAPASSANILKVPSFGFSPSNSNAAPSTTGKIMFGATGNAPPSTMTPPSTQPQSTFTFGATSTPGASSTAPAVFGVPSAGSSKAEAEKSSQNTPAGPSLMTRLGLSPANSTPSQPSSAHTHSSSAASTFSFGRPSAPAPAPAASGSSGEIKAAPTSGETSSSTSPPKFNFGFGKPANSVAPSIPASTSAPSTTFAPEPSKTSASAFSLPAPKASEASVVSATPAASSPFAAPASQNSFTFGAPSNSSSANSFGSGASSSAFGSNAATLSAPSNVASKAVSTFGAGRETSNAFTTPATEASSLFGVGANNTTATSLNTSRKAMSFGSSPFGLSTTPAFDTTDANKPSTAFGVPSLATPATSNTATATANTPASDTQNKPTFSFNFGAPSGSAPSPFGSQPSTGTSNAPPFGSQPSTNASNAFSPFGNPSQSNPSAFGFPDPPSASGSFTFGNTNTQNQK